MGIGILYLASFHIEMLVASAPSMEAEQCEHGCQNVVIAVSDVSCNIVQLHYPNVFGGAATALAVARYRDKKKL